MSQPSSSNIKWGNYLTGHTLLSRRAEPTSTARWQKPSHADVVSNQYFGQRVCTACAKAYLKLVTLDKDDVVVIEPFIESMCLFGPSWMIPSNPEHHVLCRPCVVKIAHCIVETSTRNRIFNFVYQLLRFLLFFSHFYIHSQSCPVAVMREKLLLKVAVL